MMIDNPMADPLVENSREEYVCGRCRAELDEEDWVFHWEEDWICDECFKGALDRMSLSDLADAISIEAGLARDCAYTADPNNPGGL